MSDHNTELTAALLKNESLDEFFRSHLETAMNDLLKTELTAFLGYDKTACNRCVKDSFNLHHYKGITKICMYYHD